MDRNSAIVTSTDASDGYYDIDSTYAKSTAGRNTLQKSTMVLPEGSTLTYEYLSTNGLHDADASRVTRVKVATTAVATYAYNGLSDLVGTSLPQPDVFMTLYDPADPDDYDRLDNFGRVIESKWTRDLDTDRDFYHTTVTWDRGSNITVIEDNIHAGRDVSYTNDNLGRLTKAEEGTWGGSSISSRTRQQDWTLDQVGNWSNAKLDLDGDNNWNETDEYNDTRTHDLVNQLNARNMDSAGGDEFSLTYDGVGNLTDDGEAYEYVYDVWGRLRQVKNTSNQNLIAEYWYNGLGYRITFHEDADSDQDVDANDPKYHLIYDERWRLVATYRADDDNPKEVFVSHQAGLDGSGDSSYIDSVILRRRDANSGWTSAADATMEERRYYCQNWRADVSAIITSGGLIVEWTKYSSYGIPFGLPGGDTDSDGDCDATDITQIQTWIDAPAYDVRGDVDLDGDVDSADKTLAINNYQGTTSGWNVLSAVANRIGYAGYHKDINLDHYHVRHRVFEPHLGRWTRRDPLGYVDGLSLYGYVGSLPITYVDSTGYRWTWFRSCFDTTKFRHRTWDTSIECCENGLLVAKVTIWICKRPLNVPPLRGTVIGPVSHSYVCCVAPNRDCYGNQGGTKKGTPIPREPAAIGNCKPNLVCPSVKTAKCNNPIAPKDYCLLGFNCHRWANNDTDRDTIKDTEKYLNGLGNSNR